MQKKKFIITLLIIAIFILSGCTTTLTHETHKQISWKERSTKLHNISRWSLSGVFSISHHNKTDIASFDWQQEQQNFSIEIHGPMNITNVKIMGQPGEVYLFKSAGKIIRASSPEALIHEQTGWTLPISSLTYWIRSLPAPANNTALFFDSYQHLTVLQQQGWQVNYFDFIPVSEVDLPTKLVLSTTMSATQNIHQEPLKIKMVIKSWSLPH